MTRRNLRRIVRKIRQPAVFEQIHENRKRYGKKSLVSRNILFPLPLSSVSFPFSIRWCDTLMSFPVQITSSPIMFFPVSSSFPCPPISVQFSVGDALVFSGAEIRRHVKQYIRYGCRSDVNPGPIVELVVDSKQTRGQEKCPKNTLRFSVKYSEFPIYDSHPYLVEY